MSTKRTSKFCVFFIFMILVSLSRSDKNINPSLERLLLGDINTKISSNVISGTKSQTQEQSEFKVSPNTSLQSTSANGAPAQMCNRPGVQPHESDCYKYYECSLMEGSQNKSLHLITKKCPKNQAFNIELKRCSRDISSCPLDIKCKDKGTIADPNKYTSYYLCEPRLIGSGFRIFYVNCNLYEIFYRSMGKCEVDLNYLPFHRSDLPKDIDAVKTELKILRKQDKLKLKAEEKLQKENYVKAVKDAQQEATNFICVNKGYFASKIGNKFYISCEQKNDTLEAISMQCGVRGTFYPEFSACVYTDPSDDKTFSDEEDED